MSNEIRSPAKPPSSIRSSVLKVIVGSVQFLSVDDYPLVKVLTLQSIAHSLKCGDFLVKNSHDSPLPLTDYSNSVQQECNQKAAPSRSD